MSESQSYDARTWLRANGYPDIADQVDELLVRWRTEGKKTRRNWWDILAGDAKGRPRIAGGVEFPALLAAQIRQGRGMSNGISRGRAETPPPIRRSNRWPSPDRQ